MTIAPAQLAAMRALHRPYTSAVAWVSQKPEDADEITRCRKCRQLWPCEATRLLDEVGRLAAVHDQARARLLEGGVCAQFEDCDHKPCNTNYAVWSLLDATRAPEAGGTQP